MESLFEGITQVGQVSRHRNVVLSWKQNSAVFALDENLWGARQNRFEMPRRERGVHPAVPAGRHSPVDFLERCVRALAEDLFDPASHVSAAVENARASLTADNYPTGAQMSVPVTPIDDVRCRYVCREPTRGRLGQRDPRNRALHLPERAKPVGKR